VASFYLACSEVWGDEKAHTAYIPCEVLGKRAEAVTHLAPGTAVVVDGKIMRRKVGERWETVVGCWDLAPITVPATSAEDT